MKHVSPIEVAPQTRTRGPTRRALAKQQTRAKVLAGARKLFAEHGYQGATIRDIASAAGMSTGAVFANFADKHDLFRDIMAADLEQIAADMREAASRGATVEDALARAFGAGYAFYRQQMPLARAWLAAGWSGEEGETLRALPQAALIPALIEELLAAAAARGELAGKSDLKLRGQMLYEAFLSAFRPAIFEGWTGEALQAHARDQIRILVGR